MNVLDALGRMDNESVDCIVTSPPYYGLRSYKGAETIWDAPYLDAEHKIIACSAFMEKGEHDFSVGHHKGRGGGDPVESTQVGNNKKILHFAYDSNSCSKCGAWNGQLGLEPTYQLYLNHLMLITAELKRVLKPTGTMWWNCADTYNGNKIGKTDKKVSDYVKESQNELVKEATDSLQEKSRMMLPERFAMKLIDEQQWTLRNDIVWSKPNHMPSSVKDRLSNGWEHIYLFTKAKRILLQS